MYLTQLKMGDTSVSYRLNCASVEEKEVGRVS